MTLHFYWDEEGDPRARAGRDRELLARFLDAEVQGSADLGREILGAVRRAEAGEVNPWEQTGNAYTLYLSPLGAQIQDELEEDANAVEIPLSELREALTAWIDFLEGSGGARPGP